MVIVRGNQVKKCSNLAGYSLVDERGTRDGVSLRVLVGKREICGRLEWLWGIVLAFGGSGGG